MRKYTIYEILNENDKNYKNETSIQRLDVIKLPILPPVNTRLCINCKYYVIKDIVTVIDDSELSCIEIYVTPC